MKTKFFTTAIVAATVALASCDKNETPVLTDDGIVRFTSGITAAPGTRATIDDQGNGLWEANDPVGIYMVATGTTNVVENNANMRYTAAQAGSATAFNPAGATIYYPLGAPIPVDFIAYHPHSDAVADFVYPVDLANQTPQTAIDLMTARADNSGAGYTKEDGSQGTVVNLAFSHRLVKLVMNVTKDASVPGTITSVAITGMNTRATFDLTGAAGLTAPGTPASITPCTVAAEQKYEAILLPLASLTDAHTVTFTTDSGETYTWKMSKEIAKLEAGTIYTYAVNVTKYAVTANGSINQWNVGTTGNVTAD